MASEHTGSGDLTRSLELLWGTKERSTRGPKPGLTLDAIVHAAVELADREGLTALSMRNVAAELGVGTMTLYRYVPGKSELLALMIDHVNGTAEEAEAYRGKDWRATLEWIARDSWEQYVKHSWLLQVNQVRPVLGPNMLGTFNSSLGALEELELTSREKVSLFVAIDGLVTGLARNHILQQQAFEQSGVTDDEFWETQEPFLARAMESGDFPLVAALAEDTFNLRDEDVLELAMRALLDGFETLVRSRAEGAPPLPGMATGD
ncbi:TetR/AcrR family transcriptional regulator [Streptomyces sp. P38-E01]|uniref:TetR/AcrR family transcriptional regulator n=1 Tax=Streptomyces tardus TaxID=2780544 RepID=A0A949JEH1_9ACTN|nr:TetR/AcrR family transcriptional regulator [Streptomyces tardus]MBU7596999.1 TetR/AcrR family transcriptional regulator [Streptomyces tardus]